MASDHKARGAQVGDLQSYMCLSAAAHKLVLTSYCPESRQPFKPNSRMIRLKHVLLNPMKVHSHTPKSIHVNDLEVTTRLFCTRTFTMQYVLEQFLPMIMNRPIINEAGHRDGHTRGWKKIMGIPLSRRNHPRNIAHPARREIWSSISDLRNFWKEA